jgi:hypothetical protein
MEKPHSSKDEQGVYLGNEYIIEIQLRSDDWPGSLLLQFRIADPATKRGSRIGLPP